jgi:hypothetical protein
MPTPEITIPHFPAFNPGQTVEITAYGYKATITSTKPHDPVPGYPLDFAGSCTILGTTYEREFVLQPDLQDIAEFIAESILKAMLMGNVELVQKQELAA